MRAPGPLGEVARLFLRLGVTAFGGPAAHVAMMHDEVVRRRGWVDERGFLDMVGATSLVPGPNSTELAIHLGARRAGWRGLLVAGACFVAPATLIVTGTAWAYVRYGRTPVAGGLLYGVKPVIIAIVGQALLRLVPAAARSRSLRAVGAAALGLYLLGVNELAVLAGGGLAVLAGGLLPRSRPPRTPTLSVALVLALGGAPLAAAEAAEATGGAPVDLTRLFGVFLRIGAVLYGSGYVLLAFLRGDLVVRLGWLTEAQLLDAVAVGQVTPGPVFTTATFVGYVVAGLPGALLATLGIFLPSFAFVAALGWLVPRMRDRAWTAALLDGVNTAALGLMAGVSWQLARDAVVDPLTAVLFAVAGAVLWRTRVNSAWLIAAGAAVGVLGPLLAALPR